MMENENGATSNTVVADPREEFVPPTIPDVGPPRPGHATRPSARRGLVIGAIVVALLVGAAAAAVLLLSPHKPVHQAPRVLTPSQVAAQGKASTVVVVASAAPDSPIVSLNGGSQILDSGSGWVLDASKGLIVTNAHVVASATSVQVGFDKTTLTNATVVGVDPSADIAVLKVSPAALPGLRTLPRANPASVQQGETAYALGFPGDGGPDFLKTPYQFTTGSVSAEGVNITVDTDPLGDSNDNSGLFESGLLQTDAAINPGSSGGPLVNAQGQLIGMSSAASGSAHTQGYAIPVSEIDGIVPTLANGSSIGWPGFGTIALPSQLANQLNLQGGLVITSVAAGTPADQAGLGAELGQTTQQHEYVVLVGINNQPVTNEQQYVDAFKQLQSGEPFTAQVVVVGQQVSPVVTINLTMP